MQSEPLSSSLESRKHLYAVTKLAPQGPAFHYRVSIDPANIKKMAMINLKMFLSCHNFLENLRHCTFFHVLDAWTFQRIAVIFCGSFQSLFQRSRLGYVGR